MTRTWREIFYAALLHDLKIKVYRVKNDEDITI